jgi:predicted ATPase
MDQEAPTSTSAAHLTRFVGRRQEVEVLAHRLEAERACRLLTLVGPGGVGKTRLALRVGREVEQAFGGGVVFVPLESLDYPALFPSIVATALGAPPMEGDHTLVAWFSEISQHKEPRLLILDNFEDLVSQAGLLSQWLAADPNLKIIVTSLVRLNLQGECLFHVGGLACPPTERMDAAAFRESEGAQLFLEAARRTLPTFQPDAEAWFWIAHICRLVDGLPLALELAATWIRLLPPSEIAVQLERDLDFLSQAQPNVPPRHRSLRAVLKHTWHILPPEEQRIFEAMSVFVGGFEADAAAAVAGASLSQLLSLVDRGLLRRCGCATPLHAKPRYDRHPLLWWFARRRLDADPERRRATEARHRTYYTAFVLEQAERLSAAPQLALAALSSALDNLRSAWHSAPTISQRKALAQALDTLRAALNESVRHWSPDNVLEAPLHHQARQLLHQLAQLPEVERAIPQGAHPAAVTGDVKQDG